MAAALGSDRAWSTAFADTESAYSNPLCAPMLKVFKKLRALKPGAGFSVSAHHPLMYFRAPVRFLE
jgi:hypothetical protein